MNPLSIAVIGLGRAGQARIKAVNASASTTLVHRVSRRAEGDGLTLNDALADPQLDAILVCTENASHVDIARQGLHAGKHVLVEYPLASSFAEARSLYELAAERKRVLYVEFIGLLTAHHRALKALIEQSGCTQFELNATGGYYGWVAEEVGRGHWGQLANGRLHALDDLFGELHLRDAKLEQKADGYRLEVSLDAGGVPITLVEHREVDGRRSRNVTGRLADGDPLVDPKVMEPGNLFGQDLEFFCRQISSPSTRGYVTPEQVLRNLRLAEAINEAVH